MEWLKIAWKGDMGSLADTVFIVRMDPDSAQLRLLSAAEKGRKAKPAGHWADEKNLLAAVNAGMYRSDSLTSVGYFRSGDYLNNGRLAPKYNSMLAFDAGDPADSPARLLDLKCEPWENWKGRYRSYLQGIRVVDCKGVIRWKTEEQPTSLALLGEDKRGRILFIFSETPVRVTRLTKLLLESSLEIKRMMYLEGGGPASLSIRAKKLNLDLSGVTALGGKQEPVPNVLGVSIAD